MVSLRSTAATYLLLHFHARAHGLDAIATLDDICLEGDGTWAAMQLEKQATGIAEDCARFIAPPKRSGGGLAILAGRLLCLLIGVSRHGRHDGVVFVCVCVLPAEAAL